MDCRPRVVVIDDDDSVLRGVGALLGAGDFEVEKYRSAEEFLRTGLPGLSHDAALLVDICMPGVQGVELQERLLKLGVINPVIVMTGNGDVATAVRAMRNGAVDFLEKPFAPEALFKALERAKEKGTRRASDPAEFSNLTAREREILSKIIEGRTSKEIGKLFKVSPRTVEAHRRNLMRKLKTASLADLVRKAVSAGVI